MKKIAFTLISVSMCLLNRSYASTLCWNHQDPQLDPSIFPSQVCIDQISFFKISQTGMIVASISGKPYSGNYLLRKNTIDLNYQFIGGGCSETTLSSLELRVNGLNPDLSFDPDKIQLGAVVQSSQDNCHGYWKTSESFYSRF